MDMIDDNLEPAHALLKHIAWDWVHLRLSFVRTWVCVPQYGPHALQFVWKGHRCLLNTGLLKRGPLLPSLC